MTETATLSSPRAEPRIGADLATLTISSRNYSSWSLRGWLLLRFSGLRFQTMRIGNENAEARAELLVQASSTLIPYLEHDGLMMWDVLAIAEYLHEILPHAGLYPEDRAARAHCRSISGEMHGGFAALRAALPVNLRAFRPNFPIWSGARADITRITAIFRACINQYGGPYLFGARPTVADAMFAPVCTRFTTYDVDVDAISEAYRQRIMALPEMAEWINDALGEPEILSELEIEGDF